MPDDSHPAGRRAALSAAQQAQLERRLQSARLVAQSGHPTGGLDSAAIPHNPAEQSISLLQEGLWLMAQLQPDNPAYHRPVCLRMKGQVDRETLRRALSEIVVRHAALRGCFRSVRGDPRQIIRSSLPVELDWEDLSSLPADQREPAFHQLAADHVRLPYDLEYGTLLHSRLVRLAVDDYRLLLSIHHLAFDAWSERIFCTELNLLYAAFAAGRPSPLPDLPIQYADYAAWQRSRLEAGALDADRAYWLDKLRGAPPALALLSDRRVDGPAYRAARMRIRIDVDLVSGLNSLARSNNATLAMVLLAGYLAALHVFTAQEDVLIGLLTAGRSRVETEKLIGLFVNTLPLRIDLSGNLDFVTLMERVRQTALSAFDHQELPFVELARRAQLSHNPDVPPLRTVFNFENLSTAGELVSPEGWQVDAELDTGASIYDLSLELAQKPEGLEAVWVYRTGLYHLASIGRLSEVYLRILAGAAENPEHPVSQLLRPDEKTLSVWLRLGETEPSDIPAEIAIDQMIAAQAELQPLATALVFEGGRMSFGELIQAAQKLAGRLQANGAGPGQYVALLLDRSPEMVIAILAVLQTGAAFVPLDTEHPAARLAGILVDCSPVLVLTTNGLSRRLPVGSRRVLCLDQTNSDEMEILFTPPTDQSLESPAYIIYTSGSTGEPKGVVVPHRALSNHSVWSRRAFGLSPEDIVLNSTALTFDMALFEVLDALAAGAQVVLARPGGQRDPAYLADCIAASGVTIIQMTPALLILLVEQAGFAACNRLRHVLCGGEAMPIELPRKFFARSGAALHNLYGPTETCNDATHWVCPPDWDGASIPIGRPIDNYQVYILDAECQPIPPGAPGELYLGGPGLTLGYLNRPDLTAEKFIPNPFTHRKSDIGSQTANSRLFATGDRARWLPDGSLEYLGRLDRMVKLRGYRIELGEIEAVLLSLPEVRQAAVLLMPGESGDSLAAYVAAAEAHRMDLASLRQMLSDRLPDYMLPAVCVWLDALPITTSGKLDYTALRALPFPVADAGAPSLPATSLEQVLVRLWAETLGLPDMSVNGDFFALGGHSLLAIRLAARLSDLLGVDGGLRRLYGSPTPRRFAAALPASAERLERKAELLLQLSELPEDEVGRLLEDR